MSENLVVTGCRARAALENPSYRPPEIPDRLALLNGALALSAALPTDRAFCSKLLCLEMHFSVCVLRRYCL
jgi:hypothetical protein